VLNALKQGSITPDDVRTLQAVYPKLLNSLREQISHKVVDLKTNGKAIPYATQLGMSLFLGMPLESSTLPQNMMANLQVGVPQGPPQQQGSKGRITQNSAKGLTQLAQTNATAGQKAEGHAGNKV
jgi:hypothetical protein